MKVRAVALVEVAYTTAEFKLVADAPTAAALAVVGVAGVAVMPVLGVAVTSAELKLC